MMILHPFIKPLSQAAPSIAATASSSSSSIGLFLKLRGGADVVANSIPFDFDLTKTRLEGLSYGTVTALIIAAALTVADNTNAEMTPVPDPESSTKRERILIRIDNTLKILFSICMLVSVACGIYTTIVFTLMNIYGHTALGLGLNDSFVEFFSACSKYRQYGFYSFLGTLISFNVGWLLSVILSYKGKMRWRMASPAILISVVGLFHYKDIFSLASTLIFAHLQK